ncbi:cleavage stimulating factor 64-like isoform X2 [Phragmites australis]|uniref:cleavage stimulating factor 64-like isoform X2 n=1 Tax=Phragmites australis TaxID=29695 RepID=UPI002D781DC1|nr:cleavage stimulating factor 64-like isoform X2 [Phragmites australis]
MQLLRKGISLVGSVGNIPYDATEEQLVQICEEVGPVVSFRLVIDKETGKPKGYGFCEYKDEETALSARRNLQGYEINGRQLRVDFAENGRNTDRNREKGRGGPGMASSVDTQKQLTGTFVVGDTSHQPVGLPPAIHAASVMAGVLGAAQTANVQNGLPVQYGLGNDPLTHYLARMSRHQLHEIMAELKSLTTQNKELSKNLLQGIPQLPKALFQAQIMLGMVTSQMMQMTKSQQPSSSLAQSSSHLNEPFPQPDAMISVVSRPSSLPANIPPNPTVLQESTATLHNFPQYQHASQPPVKMFQHEHQSGVAMFQHEHQSGVAAHPPMLSLPLGGSSNVPTQPTVTSVGLISQVEPPFMPQHPRQPVMPTNVQQLPLTHLHLPQVAAAPETLPNEIRVADQASHLAEFPHAPKLRKLEDGTSVPGMVNNSPPVYNAPSQAVAPSGPSGNYSAGSASFQQPENEVTQLTPDVESALLQQVLQLTPEQLSSLPLEQQQQVIQLQKMLSAGN